MQAAVKAHAGEATLDVKIVQLVGFWA